MDFCSNLMKTQITSSSPAADDHSVENLVSSNSCKHSLGFLSESFVRPPVDITLTFDAPVDIYHIIFNTRVSQKQSIAFAVYTSSQTNQDSSFERINYFNTNKEDAVHLTNAHYHRWYRYPGPLRIKKQASRYSVYESKLRSSNREALKNVRILRVCILRNASPGGSGIAQLEVWGQPGTMATQQERLTAIDGWSQHFIQRYIHSGTSDLMNGTGGEQEAKYNFYQDMFKQIAEICPVSGTPALAIEKQPLNANSVKVSESIPDEFLDPITCDVMVTPMLLPSGNSVDITTLEKFNASQSCYNRPPFDPFTGIPFNALVQPIPNVHLKTRIDRFVLLSQQDPALYAVGRSLLTTVPAPALAPAAAASPVSRSVLSSGSHSNGQHAEERQLVENKSRAVNDSYELNNKKQKFDDKKISNGSGQQTKSSDSFLDMKFKAVNFENIPTKTTASKYISPVETRGGHRGLPQFVPGPNRSSITFKAKCFDKQMPKHLDSASNTVLCSNTPTIAASLGASVKSPTSPAVSLTRSLLHQKPSRVIQGVSLLPQFLAYGRDALLRSNDKCCECGASDMLYVLEVCQHLFCRKCLLFGRADMNSDVEDSCCFVCNRTVEKKDIKRHHSKSVFSR